MSRLGSVWLTVSLSLGLALVFVGERLVGTGTGRGVLTGLGCALVLFAFVARLVRAASADVQRRPVERNLGLLAGAALLGLLVYFARSDLAMAWIGVRIADESPRLSTVLEALYPLLFSVALVPTALGEMAYAAVARAPRIEAHRIRDAILSGLGLVGALTFAVAISYVLKVHDPTWDFSYFRTAKPGEATRKLVRALDAPVEVVTFFPPGSDVAVEVANYLRMLEPESTRLKVEARDAAIDLARARELGVIGNGAVVIKSGQRKETVNLPLELDRARGDLRKLDQTMQDHLFKVTRPRRVIYLTSGHGERNADRPGGIDQRARVTSFRRLLEALNQDVKNLGASDGLATEVPADAGAVLVIGPTAALLPEEVAALNRYFARGGRILVALDPDTAPDLSAFLGPTLGLTFEKTTLVNDRVYAQHTHTPSDRALIVTAGFSSHPAVTTVSQAQGRYPVLMPVAGYLEASKQKPVQLTHDFAVRALPSTFNDLNGNFELDPPQEARKAWPLVVAASRHTFGKPGEKPLDSRALVLADSDVLSDGVIESLGNPYFVVDAIKWLIGEEAVAGETNKETDVRIEHSRGQDVAYFYLTILGVPALVLGGGLFGTRRRRKRRGA